MREGFIGELADGTRVLHFATGCGQCPSRCGGASRELVLTVEQVSGFETGVPGARAGLEVRARGLTAISVVLFGLPVTGLFAGAVGGSLLGGDSASALAGCLGLAAGYALARRQAARRGTDWLAALAPRTRMLDT